MRTRLLRASLRLFVRVGLSALPFTALTSIPALRIETRRRSPKLTPSLTQSASRSSTRGPSCTPGRETARPCPHPPSSMGTLQIPIVFPLLLRRPQDMICLADVDEALRGAGGVVHVWVVLFGEGVELLFDFGGGGGGGEVEGCVVVWEGIVEFPAGGVEISQLLGVSCEQMVRVRTS